MESRLVCCTCFFMEPMKLNCLMLHPLETGTMSVHKASPLWLWSACGWLVRRLVVKCTMLFQGCMTAISARLMVQHLFFFFIPASISIWWMAENGLDFFTALVLHYCLYCNASLLSSIHPKFVLLQSFEDNLNVSSCFVSFPQIKVYTRTCSTIQKR